MSVAWLMQSGRDEDIDEVAVFTTVEAAQAYRPGTWEKNGLPGEPCEWRREGRGVEELWLRRLAVDPVRVPE